MKIKLKNEKFNKIEWDGRLVRPRDGKQCLKNPEMPVLSIKKSTLLWYPMGGVSKPRTCVFWGGSRNSTPFTPITHAQLDIFSPEAKNYNTATSCVSVKK